MPNQFVALTEEFKQSHAGPTSKDRVAVPAKTTTLADRTGAIAEIQPRNKNKTKLDDKSM